MANPIKYSDLFGEDISSGLSALEGQINSVKNSLTSMLAEVKKEASSLGDALSGVSSASKGDRDATAQYAAQIQQLVEQNEKLSKALKECNSQLDNAKSKKSNDKSGTTSLAESYKTLSELIASTNVNLDELIKTEKQKNTASKNGEAANKSLAGSYNQLYAQYNLIKNALNAMGEEMRKDINIGGQWEKKALDIMNEMKRMQEATGKNTLSVGDYGKALNGLNIATQQVLREMPTLANSFSQFFIAISNNVPIFTDNLKRVVAETGSWQTALKGVLASVFSWQTALLALLTILPKVAQNIEKKKRAQEEANKATKEAITLVNLLKNAENEVAKAEIQSVNQLRTLYNISQDVTRSDKERAKALDLIIKKYPEASNNIKGYIEKLEAEARAKAYLNEIGKIAIKQYELEGKTKEAESNLSARVTEEEIAHRNALAAQQRILGESQAAYDARQIESVKRYNEAKKATEEARKTLEGLTTQYNDASKSIEELTSKIDVNALTSKEATSKSTKSQISGYEEFVKSLNRAHENWQKHLDSVLKDANKIAEAYKEIPTNEAVTDERDRSIGYAYDKLLAENAQNLLASRIKLNEAIKDNAYSEAVAEGKIFKQLTEEKLILEAEYQKELLAMRLDEGKITQQQYDIQLADVENALAKSVSKLSGKNKKGKFSFWNLILGETQEDGNGNVTKQLSSEVQSFASAFESSMNTAIGYMNEWIDKRIEMAEVAIEAAQEEADAAKSALDSEMEARANGYANNVELARREYEEKLALEEEATKEKERLQKVQEAVDTATQISSLLTATANLWAGYSKLPIVGKALAIAATAAMWSSFAAAKITAVQATSKTYGEGMTEYLDYGGSHASGNDIDFGKDKNGVHRRVEKGEVIGVVNKKNVQKYGANKVMGVIRSLNDGSFEDKFTSSENVKKAILKESIMQSLALGTHSDKGLSSEMYGMAFNGVDNVATDLSNVEKGINRLIEQGDTRIIQTAYGRIEYRGNNKRIIRN